MTKNVGKILAVHALQGRSPLYRWLHQHHAEIAADMATRSRPAWEALAQTARDTGQLDANGNPPNRQSIRKAWHTLERDLNRQPAVRTPALPARPIQSAQPIQSAAAAAAPVMPVRPAPVIGLADAPAASARPRNVFSVARFKQTPDKDD
jgi:hypothetical protein